MEILKLSISLLYISITTMICFYLKRCCLCRSRFRRSTTGFSKMCHVVLNAWDELMRPKPDHLHLYNNNRHYSSAISCDSCFHFWKKLCGRNFLVQMSNKWKHVALVCSECLVSLLKDCHHLYVVVCLFYVQDHSVQCKHKTLSTFSQKTFFCG